MERAAAFAPGELAALTATTIATPAPLSGIRPAFASLAGSGAGC
jgi:hypothetical protein